MFVGCLTSQQQASVSHGQFCSDNFTCCHFEIEVADQTVHLTQSQYTDAGPSSPSADPTTPGAWQGSHWSANFEVTGMTRPEKKSLSKLDSNPVSSAPEVDALKAQLRAPGNKPARGKVLFTCLSPLRQETVGRAGVLVCLAARSNRRRSDPQPGRRKFNERMP